MVDILNCKIFYLGSINLQFTYLGATSLQEFLEAMESCVDGGTAGGGAGGGVGNGALDLVY